MSQQTSHPFLSPDLFQQWLAQDSHAYTITHERMLEIAMLPIDSIRAADVQWLRWMRDSDRLAACRDHMFELEEIVEHDRDGGTRAERKMLRDFRNLVAAMENLGDEVEGILSRVDERRDALAVEEEHCCEEHR